MIVLNFLQGRKHKATLILTPSQAMGVWKDEIKKWFPDLRVKQFYMAPNRVSFEEKADILEPGILDLVQYLADLPDEPTAELTVILSVKTDKLAFEDPRLRLEDIVNVRLSH